MSSIEDMPSWDEVKLHGDLKLEAFSLKQVRVDSRKILMSQREVRALIEHNGGQLWDRCQVPGHVEAGVFEELFEAQ